MASTGSCEKRMSNATIEAFFPVTILFSELDECLTVGSIGRLDSQFTEGFYNCISFRFQKVKQLKSSVAKLLSISSFAIGKKDRSNGIDE